MIHELTTTLLKAGVAPDIIHREYFHALKESDDTPGQHVGGVPSAHSTIPVSILLDGSEHQLDYSATHATLLDAAEAAGLNVPYSCRGGVCCTCRAKILEGSAEMHMNYGLEPDELEEKYVLTCQAYPTSDVLKISYDD